MLRDDPAGGAAMGAAGRERILKDFSVETMVGDVLASTRKLLRWSASHAPAEPSRGERAWPANLPDGAQV